LRQLLEYTTEVTTGLKDNFRLDPKYRELVKTVLAKVCVANY